MSGPREGWASSPSLTALRESLTASSSMRRVVARRAGLSDHELAALEHISTGVAGPAELATSLDVSRAAATGIVDRLVARGHAVRAPHATDRRRTDVVVTASGRAEVRRLLLPLFSALAELDDGFDATERDVVARYLRGVRAALDALADEG